MPSKPPTLPPWLFDPGEVEQAVYLLEQRHPLADMQPAIEPLELLALELPPDDARLEPTRRLINALRAGDPELVNAYWLAWIAHGSGWHEYHEKPKRSRINAKNAQLGGKVKKRRGVRQLLVQRLQPLRLDDLTLHAAMRSLIQSPVNPLRVTKTAGGYLLQNEDSDEGPVPLTLDQVKELFKAAKKSGE